MEPDSQGTLREGGLGRGDKWGLGLLSVAYVAAWTWASTLHCLWVDEDFTYQAVIRGWSGMAAFLAADVHPPLYFIILKLLRGATLWMGDEASLRLPSTLAGAAGLWAYFILFKRLCPRGQAPWLAVLMLALSPATTWYAGEARPYQFLLLNFALAWLALLWFWERPQAWGRAVLLGVAWAGIPYLHNVGLVGDASFLAYALWRGRREGAGRGLWGPLALAAGVAGLLYLPHVPTLLHQMASHSAYWIRRQHNPWKVWRDYLSFYFGLQQLGWSQVPWMLFTAYALLAPWPGWGEDRAHPVILSSVLGWFGLAYGLSLLVTPFMIHRTTLCAAPFIYLAVSRRLERLQRLAPTAALLGLALLAWPSQQTYQYQVPEREDARAAADFIARSPHAKDPVVLWEMVGPLYFQHRGLRLAVASRFPRGNEYSWTDYSSVPPGADFWLVDRLDHLPPCPAPRLCPWAHGDRYRVLAHTEIGRAPEHWFDLEIWRLRPLP